MDLESATFYISLLHQGFLFKRCKIILIYRKAYESQIEGKRSVDTTWFSNGNMKFKINDITQCDYYTRKNSNRRLQKYPLLVVTFEFNIRSLMNKMDDLQQYLAEIEHIFFSQEN